jgi:hypothetical protein
VTTRCSQCVERIATLAVWECREWISWQPKELATKSTGSQKQLRGNFAARVYRRARHAGRKKAVPPAHVIASADKPASHIIVFRMKRAD